MKLATPLIALSLAANLIVLGAFAFRPAATAVFFRQLLHPEPSAASATPSAPSPAPAAARASAPLSTKQPLAWSEIAPGDFLALVARLRAAGFPPSLIQTAVTLLVEQRYNARRAALSPTADPTKYWIKSLEDPPLDTKATHTLDQEEHQLLRTLLGDDFYAAEDALHPENRRREFGDLPDEKLARLRRILSDYEDLKEQAHPTMRNHSDQFRPYDEKLEMDERAAIEHALTPDELLTYDLHDSEAARGLRNRFGKFQVTEDEFRALFPFQKIIADLSRPISDSPERQRQREEAERQLEAETRRVLGEARYAEFQLVNDEVYQRSVAFLARNNLPPASTAPFAAIQKETGARLEAINNNSNLTANQRDAQLADVAADAKEKLATLLGPDGLAAYLTRAGGGAYLNRYNRPSPPSTAP